MVGILRCGKMLPPQLKLVIEIEVRERRVAPTGAPTLRSRTSEFWPPRSSWTLRWWSPSTARSSQEGPWCSATPRRGGAQRHRGARLHETHGRVCDLLGQRRGLQDPLAGQAGAGRGLHRRGQPGRRTASWSLRCSLQHPHNPMKGASEHFHFLSVLAGTYDDTVRNVGPVHSFGGLPAGDALRHGGLCA